MGVCTAGVLRVRVMAVMLWCCFVWCSWMFFQPSYSSSLPPHSDGADRAREVEDEGEGGCSGVVIVAVLIVRVVWWAEPD